jgi:hypothetical protein
VTISYNKKKEHSHTIQTATKILEKIKSKQPTKKQDVIELIIIKKRLQLFLEK